jgi:uncharacterized protein
VADQQNTPTGQIGWVDLTVPDTEAVRDFYKDVAGWTASEVAMGDYSDYCMNPPQQGQPVAGICHARGENADIPPVWMMYITVADLDRSLSRCLERGGRLRSPVRSTAMGRYAVIEDPAGAIAALFEPQPV